jgi:hypothetical protein
MALKDRLRRLEREAEGELLVVPQHDGTIARFPPEACEEAFINFTNRLGAGEDAPPEHPLIAAARNSSDPKWTNTFFAVEDPERWVEPVEDLSERGTRPARLPPNRLMGAAGI